jgi:hypothetical protein
LGNARGPDVWGSVKRTVRASITSTAVMLSNPAFFAMFVLSGARARSKLNFTVCASKEAPSLNFTPVSNLNR